jgi:hypothetical protein
MSQAIPSPFDCNQVCVPAGTSSTPGPQGEPGAAGENGTDGINARTLSVDGDDVMPAEAATVTVTTSSDTSFMAVGQVVYVQFWGWMQVTAKPSSTSVTLLNLEDTATGEYADNAAPGTVLPAGAYIVPGGLQGPAGSTPGDALLAANDLSDLDSVPTARTNLGLGTAALRAAGVANTNLPPVDTTFNSGDAVFATATGVQTQAAGTARTSLGLGTMATQNAATVAITGGSIVGITDLAVADGGTGASTPAAARANLGVLGGYGLLASSIGIDVNSAGDTTLTVSGASRYIIDKMTVDNASLNLTTATAGVFTGAGGGGVTLAADQVLTALTATTKYEDLTPEAVVGTDVRTEGTLYFRVGTPQGAAATADFYLFGWRLS